MRVFLYRMIFIAFVVLVFSACYSVPTDISTDLNPPELIQRAQEASDRNRFKTALRYYEVVLERFPDELEFVCAAEYEIAFIMYKQKNYNTARAGFNALLQRYESPGAEFLPQQFKILSNIVLEKIDDIENQRRR